MAAPVEPAKDADDGGPPRAAPSGACIVVQSPEVGAGSATLEGTLTRPGDDGVTSPGRAPSGPGFMVLRLARPRCVVGLERASVLTEVLVATTGPDLRPLLGARLRITGDVVAGTSDLGGPAVIVLAKELERAPPRSEDP